MRRKFLTENEIMRLLRSTSQNHHGLRNYCMTAVAFYHGLRVSELISLKTDDYESDNGILNIRRLKGGFSTIHPVLPVVREKLDQWLREREKYNKNHSNILFLTMKGEKMTRQRFAQILKKNGLLAGLQLNIHPHMLRHSCGYSLADRGNDTRLIQDYLGHKNIRHTVRYTAANPARFAHAW
ncbi:tyrosine-type recombinase/integrase [Klebsiella aerogenes]|uniref:tyrosine-type recombinase/integrase n=1 Tax=Klebsiella aerogenes TaxID=548 RepID=UPI002FF7D063